MIMRLKPHSRRSVKSFLVRSAVILGLFVVLSNIAFVAAQATQDPNDLLRTAIGGTQFTKNVDLFLTLRTSPIIPSFGIAFLAFVGLALGHFFVFGAKDMAIRDEADAIAWWTMTERVLHAIIAIAFLILLISGFAITFGRYLGGGTITLVLRIAHEYSGLIFTPVLVLLVVIWFRHAIFRRYDLEWFSKAGGYMGYKGALRSGKFNAGQKQWYWFMTIFGIVLTWTGLFLFFGIGGMEDMRLYQVLHFAAAVPIILMFVAHLYMTTIGVKGAFMGMVNGRFSKAAAMAYHSEAPELAKPQPAGSD